MVGEEPKNPFANLLNSILAVYNWGSIPLDAWNFWPLVVINVIDAEKESKYSTLFLQKELICDYAFQDRSSLTSKINDFDHKFKDKLNIRYICFLDEPELTKSWDDKSNALGDRWLNSYGLHFKHEKSDEDNIEEVRFIWTREEHM
ncbi:24576_t:CDS:2, partial [Gigaspora margarita]